MLFHGPDIRALATLFLLTVCGCSQLKLGHRVVVGEGDWPTYARNAGRTNMTREEIPPPLETVWRNDVTGGIGAGSPVVADSMVFVTTLRGELHAMDARTGRGIGWVSLGDAINGSPVIHENVAYVALSNSAESLVAYDLREGRSVWRSSFGDIETSLLLAGDRLFFGNTRGEFYCVNRRDGEEVWRYTIAENEHFKGIRSTAAMVDSVVMFGGDDGTFYALDAKAGKERWTYTTLHSVLAPVTAEGNIMLGGNLNGDVVSLDVRTGAVNWRRNLGSGIYGGMALSGETVLAATSGGSLFGLARSDGHTLWKVDLGSVINAAPVVSGRYAYVGTLRNTLFCVNIADGSVLLREAVEGRIKTPVAVAYGRLYVASDDRQVIAYRPVERQ